MRDTKKILSFGGILGLAAVLYAFSFGHLTFAPEAPPLLRVDYPHQPVRPEAWDPVRSLIDSEAAIVQALYSPLLEMDLESQLRPGLAEKFSWSDERTLVLQLRRHQGRPDERSITASDALHSLKRLAFLQQDSDRFYVEQFCHRPRLESITSECPGLHAEDLTLTIRTRDRVAIMPKLLTSVETSIVPRAALAADGVTLQGHNLGSGPYTLVAGTDGANFLKAKPLHYNYKTKMPQLIELVPSYKANVDPLVQDMLNHRLDHVARFAALTVFDMHDLASALGQNFHMQKTLPMGVGFLLFSEEARSSIPATIRREWVLRLQAAVTACLVASHQDKIRQPTKLLIPAIAVGRLNPEEERLLEEARAQHAAPPLTQTLSLKFPVYIAKVISPCLMEKLQGLPIDFNASSDRPADLVFKSYDLSTYEEIGTIRSLLATGILKSADLGIEDWILRYIGEPDPGRRMAYLKDLHLRAIWDDPSVIPLWNYETGAVIRKPWVMDFSPIRIANPFHLIRYGR